MFITLKFLCLSLLLFYRIDFSHELFNTNTDSYNMNDFKEFLTSKVDDLQLFTEKIIESPIRIFDTILVLKDNYENILKIFLEIAELKDNEKLVNYLMDIVYTLMGKWENKNMIPTRSLTFHLLSNLIGGISEEKFKI